MTRRLTETKKIFWNWKSMKEIRKDKKRTPQTMERIFHKSKETKEELGNHGGLDVEIRRGKINTRFICKRNGYRALCRRFGVAHTSIARGVQRYHDTLTHGHQ